MAGAPEAFVRLRGKIPSTPYWCHTPTSVQNSDCAPSFSFPFLYFPSVSLALARLRLPVQGTISKGF